MLWAVVGGDDGDVSVPVAVDVAVRLAYLQ